MNKNNKSFINKKALGLRIKQLRAKKNFTQSQLAEILGVSRSCIANWEKGERFPENRYAEKMASLFGTSIDYIYGISDRDYKINIPDYFNMDFSLLNNKGQSLMFILYKLLLSNDEYTNK